MRRPSRRMLLEYEDFERKAVCLPDERGDVMRHEMERW